MRWGLTRKARVAVGTTAFVLVCAFAAALFTAPVQSAQAASYPSWADVQKAKHNAAAKAAEVRQIRTLLAGLTARAAVLGQRSIAAAAAYSKAQTQLQSATATYAALKKQGTAASARATTARRQAGAVTSQLYRSGDPTLTVWLSGRDSGSLLYQLGALSEISGSSTALLQQAVVDGRNADALGAQAKVAARIRDALAARAQRLEVTAKNAQAAADAEVTETGAASIKLAAQLKSLQGTVATTESQYEQGVAAKEAAAAAGASGSGGTLSSVSPGPNSLTPDGARNYAAGRMGAFGWGSSQNTCLGWLWYRESGWRWDAYNASSGAYGIAQSLPASKYASSGADWETSSITQINWGLGYIQYRYGSPCSAWSHELAYSWY